MTQNTFTASKYSNSSLFYPETLPPPLYTNHLAIFTTLPLSAHPTSVLLWCLGVVARTGALEREQRVDVELRSFVPQPSLLHLGVEVFL